MKVLWEQETAKSSDKFENGCIPMHCGAQVTAARKWWFLWRSRYIVGSTLLKRSLSRV